MTKKTEETRVETYIEGLKTPYIYIYNVLQWGLRVSHWNRQVCAFSVITVKYRIVWNLRGHSDFKMWGKILLTSKILCSWNYASRNLGKCLEAQRFTNSDTYGSVNISGKWPRCPPWVINIKHIHMRKHYVAITVSLINW